jgi:hypothetical protein
MGSGAGFVVVPLFVYFAMMVPFCVKVGDASSWRVGWLTATGLILLPLALFVAMAIP